MKYIQAYSLCKNLTPYGLRTAKLDLRFLFFPYNESFGHGMNLPKKKFDFVLLPKPKISNCPGVCPVKLDLSR